ncbi:hypothetical protein Cgig2_020035 [Carnegiea gigantea]|uniref:Endonuclease/exonuclease/phosphatase domain-containing protein n=1 Tax=Carnegiea gigantea TaxID=171969 RepID=A0A9Q1K360_9CARY|nr:hypothetical protein Cgig2_020035 [Carnegiea gigantea]
MSPGRCVAAQNRKDEAEVSLHPEQIDGTVQTSLEQARVSAMDPEVITSPTHNPITSYTAMIDPDEGTSLTFVQTQEFNEMKYAIIEPTDVMPKIDYWKTSVLCSVLGANPLLEGLDNLSKLGSVLGIPIKTDKYTKDKTFLKYARILIEIQLEDKFPEYIEFVNQHNVVVRQRVDYEWKPIKCDFCKMYSHIKDDCRKKPQTRIEWRQVVRQEPQEAAPLHPHIDKEGFITVRKKATAATAGNKNLPPAAAQEDVKIFLHKKQIGFIGLLEAKVKENRDGIGITISAFALKEEFGLHGDQVVTVWMLFLKLISLSTMKGFYITFAYVANHKLQRRDLWEDLLNIANSMDEAWCILGDFNAVLYTGDRIRGTKTNKTIWIRIDLTFVNAYWFNPFAYCHVTYMPNALSDHTALVVDFPWYPKPKPTFQFCDMWVRDSSFIPLIASIMTHLPQTDPFTKMKEFLRDPKNALQKLNRSKFADLCRARSDLEGAQRLFSQNPGDMDLR